MVSKITKTIYGKLKDKYSEIRPGLQFDTGISPTKRDYYLCNLADNLIAPMDDIHLAQFANGAGCEMEENMYALYSSSAMTFNIFGNERCVFHDGIFEYNQYEITYEKQLETLHPPPPHYQTTPAHFDAMLTSPDSSEILFFEMKMIEWLRGKLSTLSNAYLREKRYFYPDSFPVFRSMFWDLIDHSLNKTQDYVSHCKVYDVFQMSRHLLAIFNFIRKAKNKPKLVRLINCIWMLNDPTILGDKECEYRETLSKSQAEFDSFKKATKPVMALFTQMNVAFDIQYISHKDLLYNMAKNDEEKVFLDRYSI